MAEAEIETEARPEKLMLRVATPDDADMLGALAAEIFLATFGPDEKNDPQDMADYIRQAFGRDRMTAELSDSNSRFFLASIGSDVIGYAKLRGRDGLDAHLPKCIPASDAMELQRLYVLAAWHGRGVAHALMQACTDYSRQAGCHTLWLGVEETNRRAYRFYEKWGFLHVGAHTFLFGSDPQPDHVLIKQLF